MKLKYGSYFAAVVLFSSVITGCGGESEQEKYARLHMRNDQLGKEQMAQQLEADRENPPPTKEPEPTEAPTPVPKDSKSDIIYANGSKFLVTYGSAELKDGIIIYKSVEASGDEPEDILWVVPSGLIVSEKYAHKVRKIQ
jgi:hypothetical protein